MRKANILTFILFLFTTSHLSAEESLYDTRNYSTVYISAGYPLAASAIDFFDIYKKVFGGKKGQFENGINIGIGTKMDLSDKFRIGFSANFFQSKLIDSYIQAERDPTDTSKATFRSLLQSFQFETLPVMISIELVPYNQSQFRTYSGFGFGYTFSSGQWEEKIIEAGVNDYRTGGMYYDEETAHPTFRLLTGVELGFDKRSKESFLGSLILEIRYTYIMRDIDIFDKVKKQFNNKIPALNNSYGLLNGYLSISLGISFNFYKPARKKKSK